jgi:hypothetical protein
MCEGLRTLELSKVLRPSHIWRHEAVTNWQCLPVHRAPAGLQSGGLWRVWPVTCFWKLGIPRSTKKSRQEKILKWLAGGERSAGGLAAEVLEVHLPLASGSLLSLAHQQP